MILICSLLLSFILGFLLAINVIAEKDRQQQSTTSFTSKDFVSAYHSKQMTFSLTSLVLFVFFPDSEIAANFLSRD